MGAMFPRRARLPLAIGAGVVVLAGIGLLVWSLTRPDAEGAAAGPSSSPHPSASLTAAPVEPVLRPGEVVATIKGEELEVFDEPAGTRTHTLDQWSEATFQPLTLLAVEQRDVNGAQWLRVMLPVQPNQSTGWIKADDVTTTTTHVQIRIFVEERELELWDGEELVLTAPVALGTTETPTPPGLYSITDPLDSTHNDTGVYGAYALGLSGFSEVLKTFNGAPPQLAIHGTNEPGLIGQYVSNGCIRMHNEDILTVVEHSGLGTPVHIYASRAEAEAADAAATAQ
jgi:lipoprotein-anchoring transpeptidase ErfK/SrfK